MIENDILSIKWPNGRALINLREFFPTSDRRTRQLFKKMIILDCQQYEIAEDLIRWLQVQLDGIDRNLMKAYANDYVEQTGKLKELMGALKKNEETRERLRDRYATERNKDFRRKIRDLQTKHKEFSKTLREKTSVARNAARFSKSSFNDMKNRIDLYEADIEAAKQFRI